MRCEKKIRGGREDCITYEPRMNNECRDERRTRAAPACLRDGGRKGVVTDKKEYTKIMTDMTESLTCSFFFLFLIKNLLLDFFESVSGLGPPYGLTFYGEAPQLFIPLIILLVSLSFLGTDIHRTAYTTLTTVGGLCLACHKYFVNLNPIHTFTCARGPGL